MTFCPRFTGLLRMVVWVVMQCSHVANVLGLASASCVQFETDCKSTPGTASIPMSKDVHLRHQAPLPQPRFA